MKNNNLKKVVFVNPFGVSQSLAKSLSTEDRARTLADRLMTSTSKQLVLVPWMTGDHWILTIIDPHKEKVYLMDPLGVSRVRYADWVKIVQTKQSYTQAEIDEIHEEWARCVIPYVRMNNNRK